MDKYPALLRTLLQNRGITTEADADPFLSPDYARDFHDPFLLRDMDRAVSRILCAIDGDERIVIYGDYDCDGIPGSVVLHDFLKKIGYTNFAVYIPHRYEEGYGLNRAALARLAEEGAKLVVTVDSGIADHDPIAYANELGMDVIVTDHHLPRRSLGEGGLDDLPPAYAVMNPKRTDDTYPNDHLCGGGVAFKLVQALAGSRAWGLPEGFEKWFLDAAAISTIADMVPLTGENRALVHYGLKVLRKSPRPGLLRLLRKTRVDQSQLTEDDVGFSIAPHVNAASRMGVPFDAFRFLASDDPAEAGALADKLMDHNGERKELVAAMVSDSRTLLRGSERDPVLIVGREEWRPGVLGLLANKMMEEFGRPVFAWGMNGLPRRLAGTDHAKGSCRSDGRVNVVDLMSAAGKDLFLDFGGHHASGGFSVARDRIDELRPRLLSALEKISLDQPAESIEAGPKFDCALSLDEVHEGVYAQIERLAPFGVENPKPLFLFERAPVRSVRRFGKRQEHLELDLGTTRAIKFFSSEKPTSTFLAHMERSGFNGSRALRLRVVEFL